MDARVQADMLGHYNPSAGGDGFQSYFTDMLLDTDRNLQYFRAICAAVEAFILTEGKPPVVLDAGCGTGFLTACALYAGAEKVIAVDVSSTHVDAIRGRMGRFEDKVTPLLAKDYHAHPETFDMLICELLGTCSNSESAFMYMRQYAWGETNLDGSLPRNMNRHRSGRQYVVPQSVKQFVTECKMPASTPTRILEALQEEIVPTNFIKFDFWNLDPREKVKGDRILVRHDHFAHDFQCEQPEARLPPGTYAMEWEAKLWEGVSLCNTWQWAYENRSKHYAAARSSAWGLMLFSINQSSEAWVNKKSKFIDHTDDQIPDVVVNRRPLVVRLSEDIEYGMLSEDEKSDFNTMSRMAERVPPFKGPIIKLLTSGKRKYVVSGFISTNKLCSPFPRNFKALLFSTTVTPVYRHLCRLSDQWEFSTEHCLCLPMLLSEEPENSSDIEVKLIPPENKAYMRVGALFKMAKCV